MTADAGRATRRETWIALAVGVALLVPYALLHLRWLPGPDGLVGHDWSYVMPRLLAASYWLEVAGPFEIPWFTPAFLGGTPLVAHPASPYFSMLQVAHECLGPLAAARCVLVGGAAAGFVGTWLLARRALGTSAPAAIAAACVFAWNGFHATRMLAGHSGFHSSMLAPLVAYWVLRPVGAERRALALARDAALAGLVLAYALVSGNVYGLPPMGLSIVALVGIAAWRGADVRDAWRRSALAIVLALVASGAKLWTGLAFLSHAPRAGYPLPGFDGLGTACSGVFRALFLAPPASGAGAGIVNTRYAIGGHELDFGVTWVPLALLLAAAAFGARSWRERARPLAARPFATGLVALCLILPLAVNVHGEGWTAFLKSLPVLSSSSNLLRWLWTYVPLLAVGAALSIDALRATPGRRAAVALLACAAVVGTSVLLDAGARAERVYDPARIEASARAVRDEGTVPAVRRNGVVWNERGEILRPVGRDDALVDGTSQLLAYEPLFGYALEWFPMGSLHPGDPFERTGDELNAKDPASFLFPAANGGAPGAHFRADDRERLAAFLAYRPIAWNRPAAFDVLAWSGLCAAVAAAVLAAWATIARRGPRAG